MANTTTRKYVNGVLIIAILTAAGVFSYNIVATGESVVCPKGKWLPYGDYQYKCNTNNDLNVCYRLSSTKATCYVGKLAKGPCDSYKLCTQYRNFTFDYECMPVKGSEIQKFCTVLNLKDGECIKGDLSYKLACGE